MNSTQRGASRGNQVTVTFADRRTAERNVAGHDIDGDLAVIEADACQAPALPWATVARQAAPSIRGSWRALMPLPTGQRQVVALRLFLAQIPDAPS